LADAARKGAEVPMNTSKATCPGIEAAATEIASTSPEN